MQLQFPNKYFKEFCHCFGPSVPKIWNYSQQLHYCKPHCLGKNLLKPHEVVFHNVLKYLDICKNQYLLQKNFQCPNVAVIKLKLDFLGIIWVCKSVLKGKHVPACKHCLYTPNLFPSFPFHSFPWHIAANLVFLLCNMNFPPS